MSASTTKASFMKTWWLVLIAISLSTLVFAGDKDKKSAPAPAPAAKPTQQQAAPQQRQAAPQQRQAAPQQRQATPQQRQATPQQRQAAPQQQQNRANQPQVRPGSQLSGQKQAQAGPAHYVARPGDQPKAIAGGRSEFHSANGRTVTTNARGEVQRIEAPRGLAGGNKIAISRGPRGVRVVESGRPGARVVSYGPHRGFVERPLRQGYISRTYVVGGRSYAHVYREYSYRGFAYHRYVPGMYYGPRFYAWAGTPWGAPVRYAWFGLATPAPWFGYYAGYFTPYPMYASPDLWLTDYVLAENLHLAYENQQASNEDQVAPSPNATPAAATLTPEMKALIAEEVRQQIAAEKAAALQSTSSNLKQPASGSEEVPPVLKQKFFVVSTNLDITTAAGQACSLTPGDIIQRKGTVLTADGGIAVEVVSSKQGVCAADSGATLQLADLQEMSNQFRERIDAGLKTLADNQAKGLPSGPASGARAVAEGTVDPVSDAGAQLASQESDASKLEAQVRQGGS